MPGLWNKIMGGAKSAAKKARDADRRMVERHGGSDSMEQQDLLGGNPRRDERETEVDLGLSDPMGDDGGRWEDDPLDMDADPDRDYNFPELFD